MDENCIVHSTLKWQLYETNNGKFQHNIPYHEVGGGGNKNNEHVLSLHCNCHPLVEQLQVDGSTYITHNFIE